MICTYNQMIFKNQLTMIIKIENGLLNGEYKKLAKGQIICAEGYILNWNIAFIIADLSFRKLY
jgi:hypothetical protein